MSLKHNKGFTLLEVLIALAILTLGWSSIVKISNQTVQDLGYLKDKTMAQWVALYKVNEIRLESDKSLPKTGSQRGYMEMGGKEWGWKSTVKVFEIKVPGASAVRFQGTRQVDIEVRYKDDKGDPLLRFQSFITKS